MTVAHRIGALLLALGVFAPHARATSVEERRFTIGVEAGAVRFARNDVRLPNDTGSRFDMTEVTGSNAAPVGRFTATWRFADRQQLRFSAAPLSISGSGTLPAETRFDDATFDAGETLGTYRFDSYKLTYRYALADRGRLHWGIGFTAFIRDALIELRQGNTTARDTDLGFVPALHLSGSWRLSDRWVAAVDIDGLAGGPGRLLDLAARLDYRIDDAWQAGGGYRTVEGGADTDDLFTFAWLNFAILDIRYAFR